MGHSKENGYIDPNPVENSLQAALRNVDVATLDKVDEAEAETGDNLENTENTDSAVVEIQFAADAKFTELQAAYDQLPVDKQQIYSLFLSQTQDIYHKITHDTLAYREEPDEIKLAEVESLYLDFATQAEWALNTINEAMYKIPSPEAPAAKTETPELAVDNKNEAAEAEVAKDVEFFKSWQNGDAEIFSNRNWIHSIKKIKSDISVSLMAAGYNRGEIDSFFSETVNPWAKSVIENRKTKDGSFDWNSQGSQILEAVKGKLDGREPNLDVFRANYAKKIETTEDLSVTSEDDEDLLAEVMPATVGAEEEPSASMAGAEISGSIVDQNIFSNEDSNGFVDVDAPQAFVASSPADKEVSDGSVAESEILGSIVDRNPLSLEDSNNFVDVDAPQAVEAVSSKSETIETQTNPELAEVMKAYDEERAKYESLLEIIDSNTDANQDLLYLIDYDLNRAKMVFQAVESVLINPAYTTDEKRAEKLEGSIRVLNGVNQRISDLLEQRSLIPSSETAAVADVEEDLPPIPEPTANVETATDATLEEEGEASHLDLVKDDPLMQQTEASQSAEQVPVTPVTPAETSEAVIDPTAHTETVPVASVAEASPALLAYQEKRAEWRERNRDFKKVENRYKEEFANYYKNRGLLEKARTMGRSLLGLKPTMPNELAILQGEYLNARKSYAKDFRDIAALRGAAHAGNEDINLTQPEVRAAFARKFVLKPAQRLLDLQQETAMEAAKNSRVRKVMKFLSEHKVAMRVGSVALAGVLGAASGGATILGGFAVGAGTAAGRMGVGMLAGSGAGALTNMSMQGRVNRAEKAVNDLEESIQSDFNVEDFGEADSELTESMAKRSSVKAQQTAATVAAGAVVGGAASFAAAEMSHVFANQVAGENYSHEEYRKPVNTLDRNAPDYSVRSGDNLWKIMKSEYEDTLKGLSPAEQDRALDALMDKARADSSLRDSIGLNAKAGGSIDKVWAGDKLNLDQMGDELKKIVSETDHAPARVEVSAVPTGQMNPFENQIKMAQEMPWKPITAAEMASADANSIANYDASVAGPRPYSADGNYFNSQIYKDYTLGHFGGEEQLNQYLDNAVKRVEGPQTIAEIFAAKPRVFDTIKDLTMKQLDSLAKTPGAIEQHAITNGIDENKLREWMFNFGELKKANLPYSETTKFSDMFSRSEVESYVKNTYKNLGK